MKTSVIINVCNRPKMLKACLRAIELNSARVDEIIVTDDGSGPDAVDEMKAFFQGFSIPIQYVRQEDKGFRLAAARNNGIRKSTGDYLILLDCDILVMPDAIAVHLENAAPGLFLAANRAFLDDNSSHVAVAGALSSKLMQELWEKSDRRHLRETDRRFRRNRLLRKLGLASRHKPKILGCHFSIFREDVYRINGFDENYEGWGLEDDDFSMRLHKAGVRGKSVILEARAMHLRHEAVDSYPEKLSQSRNANYFKRPNVPAFCERGLKGAHIS